MKVAAPAAAIPPAATAPDMAAPAAPAPEAGGEDLDFGSETAPADDKPFDDQPFDAGVEADEDTDPKKFIEQLSGKIGQSLRKYTEETGQPDFELEKFAINSLLSATHTAEMDEDDKKDIIKKVNTSGSGESNDLEDSDMGDDETDSEMPDMPDMGDDENLQESEMNNLFLDGKGKRMSIYAPEDSPEFMEINRVDEKKGPCWTGYRKVKGKKDFEDGSCVKIKEDDSTEDTLDENNISLEESNNYMYWQNLKTIHDASGELLQMGQEEVDNMVANGHAWAVDHISTSADDIEEVYHFMETNMESNGDYAGETQHGYEDEHGSVEHMMAEGKYDDKPLGKPMKGDVKKFQVYVKNAKGNVVKVNFGDPNMEIKRDNPERKKSFRARHKCSQAKDRTTPKYWSCKMWSDTPVSKMVGENLINDKKFSIFGKDLLKAKLHETFNSKDMSETVEPMVQPIVKPSTTPAPSRRSRPFTIEPDSVPQTDPKAVNENLNKLQVYHNTFSSAVQTAGEYAKSKGYELNDDEWFNTIATGPKKPQEGQTNRYTLTLYRDGKEQRKALHIQVYGMKDKYELNTYIS